jgi:hypothetical protein
MYEKADNELSVPSRAQPGGSEHALGGADASPLRVLLEGLLVEIVVVEAGHAGLHIVLLSHVEVLSEDLVSAPPVSVNHADSLVTQVLMEVSVSDVVLVAVSGETSVRVRRIVMLVVLTNVPSPLGDHVLLLLLGEEIEHERLVQMEDQEHIDDSDSVLARQGRDSPVSITEGVLEESRNVFESTPSLGLISRLGGTVDELTEVTISVLAKSSAQQNEY